MPLSGTRGDKRARTQSASSQQMLIEFEAREIERLGLSI